MTETIDTPQPRVGCGAAIIRENKILLVQRKRAPEAGAWGLPGGKIDWLEAIEDAVRRETLEELGIALGKLKLLCVMDYLDPVTPDHWVAPVYLATNFAGEPRLVEPDKHTAFGWFPLDQPPTPLTQATICALEALRGQEASSSRPQ